MPAKDLWIHQNHPPQLIPHEGVPVREDCAFTNHQGEESKGVRKRAEKTLVSLQAMLSKVLEPEETVLYLARGQAPASVFEQLAFGWYIYKVTGAVLVFTNRRLLDVRIKPKGLFAQDFEWTLRLRSIRWGDLADAKVSGWLSPALALKYRTGKKESYWKLNRGDAKKMRVLLAALLPGAATESTPAQGVVSLCPTCFAVLTPQVYQCSQCGQLFKDEKTMVRRSLLIPGGGYFYTGHTFLAVGDFVAEAYLLLLLLIFLAALLIPSDNPQSGEAPGFWAAAGVVAAILAVEKWGTIHHCRRFIRDFIPTKG